MTSTTHERSKRDAWSFVSLLSKMHGSYVFVSFVGGASTMGAGIIGVHALKSPRS